MDNNASVDTISDSYKSGKKDIKSKGLNGDNNQQMNDYGDKKNNSGIHFYDKVAIDNTNASSTNYKDGMLISGSAGVNAYSVKNKSPFEDSFTNCEKCCQKTYNPEFRKCKNPNCGKKDKKDLFS